MAGSVDEQFSNLHHTLRWVDSNMPAPSEVYTWLRKQFRLSHYFARDVYTVLFIGSGLVKVVDGKCRLTPDGRAVLTTASPVVLLEVFEKTFAGIVAFLEVLRAKPHVRAESLNTMWLETVKDRFPRMKNWSKRTLNSQCRHRIDWLRTLGLVTSARGSYSLSEDGWQFVQKHPPEAIAIQPHEVEAQGKQLNELILGEFQPFDLSTGKAVSLRQSFVRDRAFREIVVSQYDYHCAVCEFRLAAPRGTYEAEAAHIVPKRRRGADDPRNGVCLCGTCHWLFDEGIVSVHAEDLSVLTAEYLGRKASDKSVQRVLEYRGRRIRLTQNPQYSPAKEALRWHNEQIFLG
jgi:predicted restriction endonuclease